MDQSDSRNWIGGWIKSTLRAHIYINKSDVIKVLFKNLKYGFNLHQCSSSEDVSLWLDYFPAQPTLPFFCGPEPNLKMQMVKKNNLKEISYCNNDVYILTQKANHLSLTKAPDIRPGNYCVQYTNYESTL